MTLREGLAGADFATFNSKTNNFLVNQNTVAWFDGAHDDSTLHKTVRWLKAVVRVDS